MYFLISLVYAICREDSAIIEYESAHRRIDTTVENLSRDLNAIIASEQHKLERNACVREKRFIVKFVSHSVAPYST